MIILNEAKWVEERLQKQDVVGGLTNTLSRIARYYYSKGEKKQVIKKKLGEYLVASTPNVVLVKWGDYIDRIVRNCDRYPIIEVDGIRITKKEMAVVEGINDIQPRRLAVTLLSIAKFYNSVNKDNNGWVKTKDKEIMRMANINTSVVRQSLMFQSMRDNGLIRYSKPVDSLSVQVLFIDDETDVSAPENVAMTIQSFGNVGNQYMMYLGHSYFVCQECGLVVKRKSNNQKYCKECAQAVHLRKSMESMSKIRNTRASEAMGA